MLFHKSLDWPTGHSGAWITLQRLLWTWARETGLLDPCSIHHWLWSSPMHLQMRLLPFSNGVLEKVLMWTVNRKLLQILKGKYSASVKGIWVGHQKLMLHIFWEISGYSEIGYPLDKFHSIIGMWYLRKIGDWQKPKYTCHLTKQLKSGLPDKQKHQLLMFSHLLNTLQSI